MGDKYRTIQNLEIIKSDLEKNLIFIKGSVPGSKNSTVIIQKNAKKIKRITTLEKNKKIITSVSENAKSKSREPEKREKLKKEPAKKEEKRVK